MEQLSSSDTVSLISQQPRDGARKKMRIGKTTRRYGGTVSLTKGTVLEVATVCVCALLNACVSERASKISIKTTPRHAGGLAVRIRPPRRAGYDTAYKYQRKLPLLRTAKRAAVETKDARASVFMNFRDYCLHHRLRSFN